MDVTKEQGLISPGIQHPGGLWADFGSGTGIFTLALNNLIGPKGEIYSIDKDRYVISKQQAMFQKVSPSATIQYVIADLTRRLDLPPLDGIVMANSLHFVEDKGPVLSLLMTYLKPLGRLILVEYNTNSGNHWVPYPIDFPTFEKLATKVGFSDVSLLSKIPSRFLGEMYSCLSIRSRD
jgi:ubiquinone/menaquinone biosynthesis C-methylase UbiE